MKICKKVCLIGVESTGKTTMAKSLAAHYQTLWVPEYGREYWEKEKGASWSAVWTPEDFARIAAIQGKSEDAKEKIANRVLFCDTNALATAIWHERYLQRPAPEIMAIALARHYDLWLLTEMDFPFVQDGTRDGEEIRPWMHGRIVEALYHGGVAYETLSGTHEQRFKLATRIVDKIITR